MPVAPAFERHPPLLEVTPFDHRAWLAVATALGLCCALLTLLIRIFVRAVISPPFAHDDTINLAATAFATIQSAVLLHGVHKGLGMSVDLVSPSNLLIVEKAAYASDILYLFSVYLSKCSVIALLFRLSTKRRHQVAFGSTLAISTVWVIASILVIALRCGISQPWVFTEKCTSLLLRWQIVIAFDIVTEVMIFAMSYYLIHGLHMALENKLTVVGAFGFRLLVIPFLIVRIISFPRHHLSTDPAFTLTYFYIWTQTTLYISLMTSMIPCLRPLMAGLNTAYGAFDTEHVTSQAYGSHISNAAHAATGKGRRTNSRRTKPSSNVPSKSVNTSAAKGRGSVLGDITDEREKEQQAKAGEKATVVTPPENTLVYHGHGRQSPSGGAIMDVELGLNPEVAARSEDAGQGSGGKAGNHSEAVAQDGNSIGSNDSRQMIIRKDISWAVEYSDS